MTSSNGRPASHTPVTFDHLPPTPSLRPSLPVGVAVLSILLAIVGVFILVSATLSLLRMFAGATAVPSIPYFPGVVDVYGAAILLVLGAAIVALARALWDQELWSLVLTVILLFLGLTYEFFTNSITVLFLVLLVLFIYLLAVRHHFY